MTGDHFDLIVVGGGVFGLSTALEAGRRRRTVLVSDRRTVPNPIAASFGPSRKIRSTYLDEHYTRLALEAMAGWRRLEAEAGAQLYVAGGNLNVSDAPSDAHLEQLEVNARRGGAKVRWLDTADLRREFPQFRPGRLALLEEEAGFLRATDCVVTLRGLAEKHGVRFVTGQDAAVEPGNRGVTRRVGATSDHAPPVPGARGRGAEAAVAVSGAGRRPLAGPAGHHVPRGRAGGVLPASLPALLGAPHGLLRLRGRARSRGAQDRAAPRHRSHR